ncbi:apicoplast pyruvate carrier 1-like isoform X2 [Antedon mediterranea]
MSPYITSYIRERSSPEDLRYKLVVLIYVLTLVGQGSTMILGGKLEKRFGPRHIALAGGLLMSTGVLLSYFTIQISFVLLSVTYGIVVGIGTGIAYVPPLVCALKWFPEKTGLVSGIIVAGFGGGAFIFNFVQTAYINPTNLSPNSTEPGYPNERYFSEPSLLDKVPSVFLVLGLIYVIMQLIGSVFIKNPPVKDVYAALDSECSEESKLTVSEAENKNEVTKEVGSMFPEEGEYPQVDVRSSGLELQPREILKTGAFWNLWFTFFVNGQATIFIATLWKAYGQTFISDDHFLSLIGSFSAVCNALGRVFWGHMADIFSYKMAMVINCASMITFMMTLKLCSKVEGDRAMLFIWICCLFFIFSGNYALFPAAVSRAFGSRYVGTNYGLLFTSQVFTGPLGVVLSTTLSDTLGWFGMFILISGFAFVGLVLALAFNVKTTDGKYI